MILLYKNLNRFPEKMLIILLVIDSYKSACNDSFFLAVLFVLTISPDTLCRELQRIVLEYSEIYIYLKNLRPSNTDQKIVYRIKGEYPMDVILILGCLLALMYLAWRDQSFFRAK